MKRQGKTKIVCTIGPATNSVDCLVQMIDAGMDVVRLNFSHGTQEEHRRAIENVHQMMKRTGAYLTILQDLQGPKIRVGELDRPSLDLHAGETLSVTTDPIVGVPGKISTTYRGLAQDVQRGDRMLLDDGKIELRVIDIRGSDVLCEIVVGGALLPHKGINLPGVAVSAASYTEKDLLDLEFGLRNDIDWVALSFVRTADDVRALRETMVLRDGKDIPIMAKIEKPQAVDTIDAIIAEADGVMVARGDLGVELLPEEVPALQKMIVSKCNAAGKPVVIATQMLESMMRNPTPTRAEVSDVANAVADGADAVMLSGETSIGSYAVASVQMMDRIVRRAETERLACRRGLQAPKSGADSRHDALGRAACELAEQMNAAAIVAVTHTGRTARVLARYRPVRPIVAITDNMKTLRLLNVVWGVRGIVLDDLHEDSDTALHRIQQRLLSDGFVQRDDYVVLLAGQPIFARGSTNMIKVERVT